MVDLDPKRFGEQLEQLLKDADIKHKDLADAIGVERPTVSGWVNGHRTPGLRQLLAICDFFQVPITHFLGEPVDVIRFHEPELNDLWREAPRDVREDVGAFLRFLMERRQRES